MFVLGQLESFVVTRQLFSTEALPRVLRAIADAFYAELGPWARVEVFRSITWLDLILFVGALVVAAVGDSLIRFLIRIRARRRKQETRVQTASPAASAGSHEEALKVDRQTEAHTKVWLDVLLGVSRAPLSLVIWVYAVYCGSFFLFRQWRLEEPDYPLFTGLDWLASFWGYVVLFWLVARIAKAVDRRLRRHASHSQSRLERILLPVIGRATRLLAPTVVIFSALPLFVFSAGTGAIVRTIASMALIALVALFLIQMIMALEAAVAAEFPVNAVDNLQARTVLTRVRMLRKMAITILAVLALACMLMVFQPVRQIGASMLASAGLAGVVVGFAAQRSLSTLVAGIQIALTQPIRIDDVVIVQGEWGRIEEITLTYVVVCIWDLRRLIVPINYFIEQPFENWTRTSAEILGTVFLYLDYSVPVPAIRDEVDRILENNPRWSRKVKVVQVTDAKERTVEVRILASAADAGTAFDLRCEIRERLIVFIQENYPESLPRFRAELKGPSEKADGPGRIGSQGLL
jgi:small-conductance mechanosensitive channel